VEIYNKSIKDDEPDADNVLTPLVSSQAFIW